MVVACATLFMMSSCGDKSDKISSDEISDLFNKETERLKIDKEYVEIDTGYYELNCPESRLVLEKLASAGVITYNVERYAWWVECMTIKYNTVVKIEDTYYEGENDVISSKEIYGRDTVPVYTYEEHFMVDVRITEKYMKMIKDTTEVEEEDLDMVLPKYDPKDWPQDTLSLAENWPKIAEPKEPEIPHVRKDVKRPPEKQTTEKNEIEKNERKYNDQPRDVKQSVQYPICKAMDEATEAKYNAAKKNENKTAVKLLAFSVKAVKARNIQIINKEDGSRGAKAQLVLNTAEVTPQGHILFNNVINGVSDTLDVKLTYYLDKGWTLDTFEYSHEAINAKVSAPFETYVVEKLASEKENAEPNEEK